MGLLGPARLEGDPDAPEGEQVWVVWLEHDGRRDAGTRLSPIWPPGSTAVFAPELRILDESGNVYLAEGQTFESGGRLDGRDYCICELSVRN